LEKSKFESNLKSYSETLKPEVFKKVNPEGYREHVKVKKASRALVG